jgi:hypothetical protein
MSSSLNPGRTLSIPGIDSFIQIIQLVRDQHLESDLTLGSNGGATMTPAHQVELNFTGPSTQIRTLQVVPNLGKEHGE